MQQLLAVRVRGGELRCPLSASSAPRCAMSCLYLESKVVIPGDQVRRGETPKLVNCWEANQFLFLPFKSSPDRVTPRIAVRCACNEHCIAADSPYHLRGQQSDRYLSSVEASEVGSIVGADTRTDAQTCKDKQSACRTV